MTNTIIIKGLKVPTIIGIHSWEKAIKQTLVLDVELTSPCFAKIAERDDIEKAIDYQSVANRILKFGDDNNYNLIETFASELADVIAKDFSISNIKVTIEKHGAIDDVAYVGVSLERSFTN